MAIAEGWASQVHTEGHATGQESACAQQVVARWRSGEDNLYLCCSICSTKVAACKFQSRSQSIKFHEASQLHQRAALKWQEIQDKRGVLQGYQDAAAQLTAQRCAGQTASLKTRTVGLRTYQCWYMRYFCFRAMPETFVLPRARTLLGGSRPPSGLGMKGGKTSNKGFQNGQIWQ